jgi:hypothetical protein
MIALKDKPLRTPRPLRFIYLYAKKENIFPGRNHPSKYTCSRGMCVHNPREKLKS